MRIIRLKVKNNKVTHYDITGREVLDCTLAIGLPTASLFSADPALAAGINLGAALDPIVKVVQDLAKPLTTASATWGFIKVIIGHKNEGYKQIRAAGWGYLGVMLVPTGVNILSQIGKTAT